MTEPAPGAGSDPNNLRTRAEPDGEGFVIDGHKWFTSNGFAADFFIVMCRTEDPNAPGERVTRGGDHVFDVAPDRLTGYFRDGFSRNPRRGHRHIGFRCAKDVR
jgi:alkylation response protein AidB-like acyl-CoA dehydrogenase